MTRLATLFAWVAAGLAAVAAAGGLLGVFYRDVPAMIEQAQAADLATLFVAVPLLAIALARRAPVVVAAALAYLAYTYAIFSFEIVLNPLAPVYIAILSLAMWSIALSAPELASADAGRTIQRRSTSAFLAAVAVLFGALWLSDIAGSIMSGVVPSSVSALDVPTSAVYALDLGFVLPLFLVAALGLARRTAHAGSLALGSLVFLILMALSILPMFAFEALGGQVVDPVAPIIFGLIAAVATALVGSSAGVRNVVTLRPVPSN